MTKMKFCSCGKIITQEEQCQCKVIKRRQKNNNDRERNKELTTTRWKKFRKTILNRDGHKCLRCLIKFNLIQTDNLQVHHIKPRIRYEHLMYEPTNCITLCASCNHELGTREELDFDYEVKEENLYCL